MPDGNHIEYYEIPFDPRSDIERKYVNIPDWVHVLNTKIYEIRAKTNCEVILVTNPKFINAFQSQNSNAAFPRAHNSYDPVQLKGCRDILLRPDAPVNVILILQDNPTIHYTKGPTLLGFHSIPWLDRFPMQPTTPEANTTDKEKEPR